MSTRASRIAIALALSAMVLVACGSDEAPAPASAPKPVATEAAPVAIKPQSPVQARGPQSTEARVVQGIGHAFNLRVLSLDPIAKRPDIDCRFGQCLDGNVQRDTVMLGETRQQRQVADVLRGWLVDGVLTDATCTPAWGHAIAFSADSAEYIVLLDYTCGQYRILVDGTPAGTGSIQEPPGKDVFDELLGSAPASP